MVSVVGDVGMNTCQCLGEGCEAPGGRADSDGRVTELQCEDVWRGSKGLPKAGSFHNFAATTGPMQPSSPAQLFDRAPFRLPPRQETQARGVLFQAKRQSSSKSALQVPIYRYLLLLFFSLNFVASCKCGTLNNDHGGSRDFGSEPTFQRTPSPDKESECRRDFEFMDKGHDGI